MRGPITKTKTLKEILPSSNIQEWVASRSIRLLSQVPMAIHLAASMVLDGYPNNMKSLLMIVARLPALVLRVAFPLFRDSVISPD
jgi:hypothetical protein